MVWMLFIGVLVVAMLYILWQMEQIGKTNKGLQQKLNAREQELLKLQQATYQLAEQQKAVLEQQVSHLPANPVLSADELQLARLLCISLPVVVKECCSKSLTPHLVVAGQLKKHSTLSVSQLERMVQKHSRLTSLWRNNSLMSHLQLCTVVALLAQEEKQAKVSSL